MANLKEQLATLYHEAWSSWCRYFLTGKHNQKDLMNWYKYMNIPYKDLPEEWKDNSRFWATKAYELIQNGK